MAGEQSSAENRAFTALRQFVKKRKDVERCELCSAELIEEHPHLVEISSRQLVCACDACSILFSSQTASKYRRVPRRVRVFSDFQMTEGQWEELRFPISIAFFFYSSPAQKVVVFYPSPAGATESLLSLETWSEVVKNNPALTEMEPDVEALLVYRMGQEREYYLVPIDECYRLVGLIRSNWRGLSGGQEVWAIIRQFFAYLKKHSTAGKTEGSRA